jgi:hypothetical protein
MVIVVVTLGLLLFGTRAAPVIAMILVALLAGIGLLVAYSRRR